MATLAEFKKLVETGEISKLFEKEFLGKTFSIYPTNKDKDSIVTFPSEADTPDGDEVCTVLTDYFQKQGYFFESRSKNIMEVIDGRILFPNEGNMAAYITANPRFQRGGFRNTLRISIMFLPA